MCPSATSRDLASAILAGPSEAFGETFRAHELRPWPVAGAKKARCRPGPKAAWWRSLRMRDKLRADRSHPRLRCACSLSPSLTSASPSCRRSCLASKSIASGDAVHAHHLPRHSLPHCRCNHAQALVLVGNVRIMFPVLRSTTAQPLPLCITVRIGFDRLTGGRSSTTRSSLTRSLVRKAFRSCRSTFRSSGPLRLRIAF
jgi:hypothetical protein